MNEKWDRRYLALAEHIAQWSRDPSTKVGAVIVDSEKFVVSLGYNGLPKKVQDLPERYENRDLKLKLIVHAERNALISAKRDLTGCTLYTWPMPSCSPCAGMVIQSGITRVVAPKSDHPRLQEDFKLSLEMFAEAHIVVQLY